MLQPRHAAGRLTSLAIGAAALLLAGASLPALAAGAPPQDTPSGNTPEKAAEKTPGKSAEKSAEKTAEKSGDKAQDAAPAGYFKPERTDTDASVTIGGQKIDYTATVGTLVVHPKDWDDAPQKPGMDGDDKAGDSGAEKPNSAEAAMSYVAYVKKDAAPESRPVTFFFNGGPGSSTVWLHMGAFGPRRVVTLDDQHAPAAPYQLINNAYSLLDASDLVFIDAPGTGFGRLAGPNKEKAFFGIDPDAHAFKEFITQFLTKFGRWNSPKYLFGESYGTTRNAVLVNMLENDADVDVNGVIMLSQILAWDLSVDGPEGNPAVDTAYVTALPTYAATAWYHNKLPNKPADLHAFLAEVEHFATTDYAQALGQGNALSTADRAKIVAKLHDYTGLPAAYIDKANLRVSGGEFEKNLQDDTDTTTGRLDSRFSGPTMDPLSKTADYDPQSAAISSAYVSVFNDYVRRDLHYDRDRAFRPETDVGRYWSFQHVQPGSDYPNPGTPNVIPDLAAAMKYNPDLKVLVNGGVYDLATPYFAARWELAHLPIPPRLQGNISFKTYESGHMVYAHEPSLKELHDNVAGFIESTDNVKK